MTLHLASEKQVCEDEIQISYFVKKRSKKNMRIGSATLLDISNIGLCMEISPLDCELYMETRGDLFLLSRWVDIQIFCRSYPTNISIEGKVEWIKRTNEQDASEENDGICVGVLFSFANADQRKELAELVRLVRNDTVQCHACGAPVSTDVPLCYKCGARLVRKKAFFKKIIHSLLAGGKEISAK